MASIQSLGIGSGILTSELVDQIIEAERQATDLRLERKSAVVDAKISAYGEIKSAISNLQAAAMGLSSSTILRQTTATSSNTSALTATTGANAEVGSYNINVNSVATSHTIASRQYNSVTDTVGTGSLTFRFGTFDYDGDDSILGFAQNSAGREFTLDLDSSNNTLGGVRDAINRADIGVQASIVNDGTGFRLLLSSKESGFDNAMEITATGDAGLQSLAYNQTQQDPAVNMLQTQKGANAELTVNGLPISSRSNKIDEVIRGVTLNVQQTGSLSLSVSNDPSVIVERTEAFIDAYNEFKDLYDEVTKFDPSDPASALLLGDSTLRNVQNQVRSALNQIVLGLESDSVRSLADIGIFTDRNDNFKLALDSDKLTSAFQANIDSVTALFSNRSTASDPLINFITRGTDTKPGTYDVEITQVATQGRLAGLSTSALDFASPLVIGGSNDGFRLNVDGTSANIALAQGSYASGDDLALMIQNAINNNETMSGRGRSVSVLFDADKQSLEIISSRFGSTSQVYVESADATVANTLGLVRPGQGGVNGNFYTTLDDRAFGATTASGTQEVFKDASFNFAINPISFELNLTGTAADGPYSFMLDQDMSNVLDINGQVVEKRDREDLLSYINAELAGQGLNGVVRAEFNASNRLVFTTPPEVGTQTIELSGVAFGANDVLGLAGAQGTYSSGVSVSPETELQISFKNRYAEIDSGLITVPPGMYQTPEDLAAAIQSAINSDPTVQDAASGAATTPGSRPITTAIDFDARNASFSFDFDNGVTSNRVDVIVGVNGADNLDSIQQALDAALMASGFDAGDVKAKNVAGGLVLESDQEGSDKSINVVEDGRGGTTSVGSVLAAGLDFSADPTTFTLELDSRSIDIVLDQDRTGDTAEETLAYIQQQLDLGLVNVGGGGVFTAGDVKARLNDAGEIFFESQSRNGVKTSATFGALSILSVTAVDDPANNLGLSLGGNLGKDAFGLPLGNFVGFDAEATVTYQQDTQGRGGFNIQFDNETTVNFAYVSASATAQLGFTLPDGSETQVQTGKNVEGLINGVKAVGNGQLLTASSGAEAATNGYILGSPGFDFSSAVVINAGNKEFNIRVDGIDSGTISLTEGTYGTGNELAAEIRARINADASLSSAGKSVDVQFDLATNIFAIFSTTRGVESTVQLTSIDNALANITGLTPGSEKIDGKAATGKTDPAAGMVLRVLGGQPGSRGSVITVSGVFEQLNKLFGDMLRSNGAIAAREKGLDKEADLISEERSRFEARIQAQEARLRAQFLFNDKIISRLNSTESFIQTQFDIMNANLANKK